MKNHSSKQLALAAALATVCAPTAFAQIFITEVAPWGSGNSSYTVDWFELTNTGASAVDITGWKIDDDSNAFGSAANLRNVTSIAPGQSVVFLDVAVANEAAKLAAFTSAWFGASAPSNFAFGYYNGAGGLGTGGDAINIFNSTGSPQASVTFGASDAVSPFQSFDNAAGLNNTAISLFSEAGVNGAITAFDTTAVGSPGLTAVPEPSEYAAAFGVLSVGLAAWFRRRQP